MDMMGTLPPHILAQMMNQYPQGGLLGGGQPQMPRIPGQMMQPGNTPSPTVLGDHDLNVLRSLLSIPQPAPQQPRGGGYGWVRG